MGEPTHLLRGVLRPLLTVPEFYVWDSSFSSQYRVMTGIGLTWGGGTPSWLRPLAVQWHRKRISCNTLEEIVTRFLLESEGMSDFFSELRRRWKGRYQMDDGELPVPVENLIIRLDPANWSLHADQGGNQFWALTLPDAAVRKRQPIVAELDRAHEWRTFPMVCRSILRGDPSVGFAHAQTVFDKAMAFTEMPFPDELAFAGDTPADAVCGAIAVLVEREWSWLTDRPERLEWCTERLDACLQAPPARSGPFAAAHRIVADGWTWEVFAALAGARLWLKLPNLAQNRRRLSALVMHDYAAVVETVFWILARDLSEASMDFRRLLDMAFRWSLARGAVAAWPAEDRARFAQQWREAESDAFAGGMVDADLGSIDDVVGRFATDFARVSGVRPSPQEGGLRYDPEMMLASNKWRQTRGSSSAIAIASNDRFWSDAWRWTAPQVAQLDGVGRKRRREPSVWERAVFWEVGRLASVNPDESLAEEILKSALELGPPGEPSLNFFLGGFVDEGMKSQETRPRLIARWRKLVKAAFSEPYWQIQDDVRDSLNERRIEFWKHVLAFDWASQQWLNAEHAPVLAHLIEEYSFFAERYLPAMPFPEEFLRFLASDSAARLLVPMLERLAEVVGRQAPHQEWVRKSWDDGIIAVLLKVWSSHREELHASPARHRAFLALLQPLVDRQEPTALELARAMQAVGSYGL
jgi:hypothetical protein